MAWLDGKRTYLVAILVGLATVARSLDWISPATYEVLLGLLGAGGIAALRKGVAKGPKG